MDQSQQELRRAAAKAFAQSLNQLEQQLQATEMPVAPAEASPAALPDAAMARAVEHSIEPIDLQALEEAAADIEQFMKEQFTNSQQAPQITPNEAGSRQVADEKQTDSKNDAS